MQSQGTAVQGDRQQVSEKPPLQQWVKESIWSLVCAMELGLISDHSSRGGNATANRRTIGRSSKAASRRLVRNGGRRKGRTVRRSRTARTTNENVSSKDSTVDAFWRSCKRRSAGRSRKFRGAAIPTANDARPASERSPPLLPSRSARVAGRTRGKTASKRQRIDTPPSTPTRPNDFQRNDRSRVDAIGSDSIEEKDVLSSLDAQQAPTLVRECREAKNGAAEMEGGGRQERPRRRRASSTNNDAEDESVAPRSDSMNATRSPASFIPDDCPTKFDRIHTLPLARRISNESDPPSPEIERNETSSKDAGKRSNSSTATGAGDVRAKISRRKIDDYPETRRVTRGSMKIAKEFFIGKLIWGSCAGWWPALIVDADHVGMLPEAGKSWVFWIGEARISLLNEKTQIEQFSRNLESRLTQNLNVARVRAIDATMQMLRGIFGCTLTKPYWTWIENNFSNMIEILDETKFYPYPPKIQQRLDYLKEKNAKVTEKYLLDQKKENQAKRPAEKAKETPQRSEVVDLTRLPLREQNPGVIAWAKIAGHNWWPAMIIDYRDCCMQEPNFGCQWIMWYGDYKLSQVHHQLFLRFDKGMERMRDYINKTKRHAYLFGVLQAAKDYCVRLGVEETADWSLNDAFEYFSRRDDAQTTIQQESAKKTDSIKIYDKYSTHIVEKLNESKNNPKIDEIRADEIRQSEDLRSATNGTLPFESLCLKCLKAPKGRTEIHPFFEGALCKDCSGEYKPRMFVIGNDAKCFYCTVCGNTGTMVICDTQDCPRVYCTACMKLLLCPTTFDNLFLQDPWECFLCLLEFRSFPDMVLKPRANWKEKIIDMFRTNCDSSVTQPERNHRVERKLRVLSLFDGLGTGLLVLRKLGLAVDVYYASEIDPDALMVSASHFGDRIVHLGDVKDITKEKIKEIAPIDLLIGGSPCNDLSLANPARLGLHDPKGTGILFFEYCRILDLLKKLNSRRRLFWLYENVASMPTEYRLEINKYLGQEPDVIDSADFSPQHRLRLYWHNLPIEPHSLPVQEEQDVQDILTPHCKRYALVKKIRTVTTKVNSLKQGKMALKPIVMNDESDSLWITELEEIFGFPRHYTDVKNLSATKRQRLIGKSWSVQTLTAIFRSLCPFFRCDTGETASS